MISGFVIFMTASNNSVWAFLISRVSRLTPAFWICCSLTALVTIFIGGERFHVTMHQYLWNMITLGSTSRVAPVDGAYWSLWIEIKFYFLVLLLMVFRLIRYEQSLLWAWALATWTLERNPVEIANDLLVVNYAWYFIVGASVYQLWSRGAAWHRYALAFLSFGMATSQAVAFVPSMIKYYRTDFNSTVVAVCMAAFFLVMLLVARGKTTKLAHRSWLIFGAVSYPLYLLHQYVGYMLANKLLASLGQALTFWTIVAICLLVAWLVHVVLEKPMARAMKKFIGMCIPVRNAFR